jgi:S-adenosylmethionine/arginine decarboxylase-like enzyme
MNKFQPQGITGVAILGESHAAIHTWPENGQIFIDIATCTNMESASSVFECIKDSFPGARISSYQESVVEHDCNHHPGHSRDRFMGESKSEELYPDPRASV